MNEFARRRFDELKEGGMLPSPRGVALKILEMTRRADVGVSDIAPLVQMDPAMAGRLLRYANAAQGGSRRPIASLRNAVTFLGLARLRQVALAFTMIDQYRSGACPAFDYTGYWTTSLATGIAAQQLSPLAASPPDESFTCGLLSGVGRLALATAFPAEYAEILTRASSSKVASVDEQARFGIDHAYLSAEMLLGWGLPGIFADAVRHHEEPSEAPFSPGTRAYALTHALHFAMRIGQLLYLDESRRWERVPSLFHAAALAGMDKEDVPGLVERVMAGWRGWAHELGLPAGTDPDLKALLEAPPAASPGGPAALVVLPLRVILMARDAARLNRFALMLVEKLGLPATTVTDWTSLRSLLVQHAPEVAIVDVEQIDEASLEQVRRLRAEAGPALHCIALLPAAEEAEVPRLMLAGASDYLLYDASEAALRARLATAQRMIALQEQVRTERAMAVDISGEWARANRRLLHEALTDALTQLPNRRYGLDRFAQEWSVAKSNDLPLACLMIDIDHFKRVNDTHGHETGDVVLRQIATVIEGSCRRNDVAFRYGGEEFCVICTGTGLDDARQLGERIAAAARASRFGNPDQSFPATLSVGVAVRTPAMEGPETLIAVADRALYAAKAEGRDRVVTSS